MQTTNFKKNKNLEEIVCYVCGKMGHVTKKCRDMKGNKNQQGQNKAANMVGTTDARTAGYGNMYSIFSTCQSTDWWVDTGANIHVCADMSLFSSYQVTRGGVVLMGNGSRASVHGVVRLI